MALNKHADDLVERYGNIYILDLLSQVDKQEEARLGSTFDDLLSERNDARLQIYHFDFHDRTRGDNFDSI